MKIPKQGPVIAIDGPAGTGKSSVTKRLCDRLGFTHVDTGALYRSIAWLTIQKLNPDFEKEESSEPPRLPGPEDEGLAVELARTAHLEFRRKPKLNPANRVFVNGKDITDRIRTPLVSQVSSQISALPGVRASLLGLQRRLGCVGKSILEGRDIGTVVFPDADVKFFLTADVDERAKRRLAELEASGADAPSFEEVRSQIAARDRADSERAIAPLKKASDAQVVDTSRMTLDEVVNHMETLVGERIRLGTKT